MSDTTNPKDLGTLDGMAFVAVLAPDGRVMVQVSLFGDLGAVCLLITPRDAENMAGGLALAARGALAVQQ